jgi:hypothetical protein
MDLSFADLSWLVAIEEPSHGALFDWTVWTAIEIDSALLY